MKPTLALSVVFPLCAVVGCASTDVGGSPDTAAPDYAAGAESESEPASEREPSLPSAGEAVAAVDDNLAQLAALDVFEVGALIVAEPKSARNCYGPCDGYEEDLAEARAQAAVRLARFTQAAVHAAEEPLADPDPGGDLEALRALAVVEVGALLHTEPKENPRCYNLPCSSDLEEAEAQNEERAGRLAAIVAATEEL